MARKYKAVELTPQGELTDPVGISIICPIRNKSCHCRCAWFSVEDKIARCTDSIIGALKSNPIRSFRLHKGPLTYNPLDPMNYEEQKPKKK